MNQNVLNQINQYNFDRSGNLPVSYLKPYIQDYLLKIDRSLKYDVDYEISKGFKSEIIYNAEKTPIDGIAELNTERQIVINEPYLAFLWSLCYCFIVTMFEIKSENTSNITVALDGMDYTSHLFVEWCPWPIHYPAPNLYNPRLHKYVTTANHVFCIATTFIIYHEFSHQYLGHALYESPESAQEEEFEADMEALSRMLMNIEDSSINPKHLHMGIIMGIGSILHKEKVWEAGDTHPDSEERLSRILTEIAEEIGDESWYYGQFVLITWGLVNKEKVYLDAYDDPNSNNKEIYNKLKDHYRACQKSKNK